MNIKALRRYYDTCPALFAFFGFIAGSALVIYPGCCSAFTAFSVFVCGIVLHGRYIYRWLLPFLTGVFLAYLHEKAPWSNFSSLLPREECSAVVMGRMGILRGEGGGKWQCDFHLKSMMKDGSWVPCRGKVMGIFRDEIPYSYGAECKVEGAFLNFENKISAKYGKYLGASGTFHAGLVTDMTGAKSLLLRGYSTLLELRHSLNDLLLRHIDDKDAAGIYSAMIFGLRGGLTPSVRENFVKSSTVHLFSISGLHIGLMSLCLIFIFRLVCLPYRLRLPAACVLLFFYILLSGGAPSALRAWLMILLVVFAQLAWRRTSGENTLGAAGLSLVAVNPHYILHTGFIFSFVLVFTLLRSYQLCRSLSDTAFELRHWIPVRGMRAAIFRKGNVACNAFAMVFMAWLGCCGVMMHYNGIVSYGALLVNAVLGPLALFLVASAAPGIILSCINESCAVPLAGLQEYALQCLMLLSEAGAAEGLFRTGMLIPSRYCILYYLLLILFLSGMRPYWIRCWALAAMLAMIFYFPYRSQSDQFVICCAAERGGVSCIAYSDSSRSAWILRPGARDAAGKVLKELKRRGRGDCINIMVTAPSDLPGAELLVDSRQGTVNSGKLVLTGKKTRRSEKLLELAAYNGWNIHCSVPEMPVRIDDISPGCRLVEFNGRTAVLKNSLRPECNIIR